MDKAFRERASKGPIYLFFSVNASGHFCGMAQMLTPVDYNTSSNVWAQDGKWKGTFKVRWIFIKDIPNNQLRHIRLREYLETIKALVGSLTDTIFLPSPFCLLIRISFLIAGPEQKSVTQSRDTQELPFQAGLEVLQILSDFQASTSLLQDMDYYNHLEQQQPSSSQNQSPNPQSSNDSNQRQAPRASPSSNVIGSNNNHPPQSQRV